MSHSARFCDSVSVSALFAVLAALTLDANASDADVIQVHFENSCKPVVQEQFDHAVTLLHSFEYTETIRRFDRIIEQDPGCAMAYWGVAMSIWHPLWAPPSEDDLRRGAAILDIAPLDHVTDREAGFINALKAFFSSTDTSSNRQRVLDYEARMSEVYRDNLDDPEAVVFYALAVRSTAQAHDKSYAQQFKAAALLNWLLITQPTHPGVLHYIIHSYDYPALAHLSLDAALTYADAAPDSAHAQHMPSHIFTRLGMWDRSLASNHDSTASAAEYTERAHLPGHYDEGLHSMDYLMYAMLQTARDEEARELLLKLRNISRTDTENFKVAYTYASSPARYALERREWQEASRLELIREAEFPWQEFDWARSIHYFARGIGAARSGQIANAHTELAKIVKIREELPDTLLPYWREEVQVHVDTVTSWILLAEGDEDGALRLAAIAADREDAVDKHPVTPGEVIPARELYADMLLETGQYAEALEQYQTVLAGSPKRLNALLGAADAARRANDNVLADQYGDIVREQTRFGNPDRAGLAAVTSSGEAASGR